MIVNIFKYNFEKYNNITINLDDVCYPNIPLKTELNIDEIKNIIDSEYQSLKDQFLSIINNNLPNIINDDFLLIFYSYNKYDKTMYNNIKIHDELIFDRYVNVDIFIFNDKSDLITKTYDLNLSEIEEKVKVNLPIGGKIEYYIQQYLLYPMFLYDDMYIEFEHFF